MASAPTPRIGKFAGPANPAPTKRRAGRKPPQSALRKPVTMPFRPGLINR